MEVQKDVPVGQETQEKDQYFKEVVDLSKIPHISISDEKPKRVRGLRGKKKMMIASLIKSLGIVTTAVKEVGITRETHYRWLKDDPKYKEAVEASKETIEDFYETAFLTLVADKNPRAIIHLAKTKLRNRGYGEHMVTEEVGKDNKITLEIVRTNENTDNQDIRLSE